MQSDYILINVEDSIFNVPAYSCRSHSDIPAEHLFGNTNWVKLKTEDESIVSFQCQQCLQIRTYKRKKEIALL